MLHTFYASVSMQSKANPSMPAVILNEVKDLGFSCCAKILRHSVPQDDSGRSTIVFYTLLFTNAFDVPFPPTLCTETQFSNHSPKMNFSCSMAASILPAASVKTVVGSLASKDFMMELTASSLKVAALRQ